MEKVNNSSINLGNKGEQIIADLLKKNKFQVLAQNYRTRFGEIDLIAQREELLVFVEVKTRNNEYFPISTVVTLSKQRKMSTTAKYFILQNEIDISKKICRFDVATVVFNGANFKIDYIENAFFVYERSL